MRQLIAGNWKMHCLASEAVALAQGIAASAQGIAASLAHVDALYVVPARRREGAGRLLLARAEDVSNYYNCHKMTVPVLHGGEAQKFFLACGYVIEAVIPQHTFKLDVALLRKFLL